MSRFCTKIERLIRPRRGRENNAPAGQNPALNSAGYFNLQGIPAAV